MTINVAVIGAGAAGLAAARHLAASPVKYSFTVFEQTGQVGGTWVFTEKVGVDDYGLPIHTSMYKSLRTNLPKEVMGYPDFPIPQQEKSYLPAADILQFLNDYMNNFNLKSHIKFHHHVKLVTPFGKGWSVTVLDAKTKKEHEYKFDAIMICNGHYNTPYIPDIPGDNKFYGLKIHSHDYRTPDTFKGKRVAVLGAGPSGMDLALEISSAAKQVILSHRMTIEIKTIFPDNVTQKPLVTHLNETEVVFEDGSSSEVDVLFYCTGYKYNFPFLSEECKIVVEDNNVQSLFKHLINTEFPSMCFIGLPFYVCHFYLFDLQCRFFLKTLEGKVPLPTKEEMDTDTAKEMSERRKKGLTKRQSHMMGPLQGDYYDELAKLANIPGVPPVMTKLHNDSSERFLEDLVNYRNDIYRILDSENFIQIK